MINVITVFRYTYPRRLSISLLKKRITWRGVCGCGVYAANYQTFESTCYVQIFTTVNEIKSILYTKIIFANGNRYEKENIMSNNFSKVM